MHSEIAYYGIAILTLLVTACAALRAVAAENPPRAWTLLTPSWALWVAATATLIAWSWPAILLNRQLNPDESMFLAEAHIAAVRPVPWLDFDPTTSGPFNIWPLTILHALGFGLTYATARVLAVALILLSVFALYRSIQLLFGEAPARLSVLCAVCFYATAMNITDFAHYSSETVPMFLIAYLGLAIVKMAKAPAGSLVPYAGVAGALAGMIPLAKLQAAPLDAVLGGLAAAVALVRGGTRRQSIGAFGAFALCAVSVPAAVLIPVAVAGGWGDFVMSYVRQPLWWTAAGPNVNRGPIEIPAYGSFFLLVAFLSPLCAIMIGLALFFRMRGAARVDNDSVVATVVALVLVTAGACAVALADEPLGHHLLLLVIPICALAGSSFAVMLRLSARGAMGRRFAVVSVAALVIASAAFSAHVGNEFLRFEEDPASRPRAGLTEIALPSEIALVKEIPATVSLAVWGWAPEVYVLSGAIMGTRDVITQHQMWPGPNQAYYLGRYMRDLKRYRPEYFLDAVRGHGIRHWTLTTPQNRLKNFGPVAKYVFARYALVAQADGLKLYRRIRK